MKLSLKNLLLLVATAALGTLSAAAPVEYKALEGDVALVDAQAIVPAPEVALPDEATTPADAELKSEEVKKESRFIRTGMKALDYIVKNRAFVVKRFAREIIIKLLKEHFGDTLKGHLAHNNKDKPVYFKMKNEGGREVVDKATLTLTPSEEYKKKAYVEKMGKFSPQGEAGESFRARLIEGALESAVIASLDASIKTEEEDWLLSMVIAGFFEYAFEKDHSLANAFGSAVKDYLTSADCAKHLGKHDWAWHLLTFFDVKKIAQGDLNPIDAFSAEKGISGIASGFLAFNPKTRIPSFFDKSTVSGKFGDSFVKNLIGRSLVPGFLGFIAKESRPGQCLKDYKTGEIKNNKDVKKDLYAYATA